MTKDEALSLALDWFICYQDKSMSRNNAEALTDEIITAIKEALAQPEQEPVAWVSTTELLVMRGNALGGAKDWRINLGLVKQDGDVGLYTTTPQRKPLTDEQIVPMFRQRQKQQTEGEKDEWYFYAWGVSDGEAAHNIKGEA